MNDTNYPELVNHLLEAKGIIVIIGAGVSLAAGIPTFTGTGRIKEGFKGRSLRDVMSTQIKADSALREEHCKLIASLASKAIAAKPTSFHHMLRQLDETKMLLRVYTQNIDGLESKAGFDLLAPSWKSCCIALHGSLVYLRCENCSSIKPIEEAFKDLKAGILPMCSKTDRAKPNLRKRTGPCGIFYPDIVLYDDPVKDGENIEDAMKEDVSKIPKNGMLLIVGTLLKIPGVKDMIRTFGDAFTGEEKSGRVVYMDVDPKVPDSLRQYVKTTVHMDCQLFAEKVIAALNAKGVKELPDTAELRKDMRPFWAWDWL